MEFFLHWSFSVDRGTKDRQKKNKPYLPSNFRAKLITGGIRSSEVVNDFLSIANGTPLRLTAHYAISATLSPVVILFFFLLLLLLLFLLIFLYFLTPFFILLKINKQSSNFLNWFSTTDKPIKEKYELKSKKSNKKRLPTKKQFTVK